MIGFMVTDSGYYSYQPQCYLLSKTSYSLTRLSVTLTYIAATTATPFITISTPSTPVLTIYTHTATSLLSTSLLNYESTCNGGDSRYYSYTITAPTTFPNNQKLSFKLGSTLVSTVTIGTYTLDLPNNCQDLVWTYSIVQVNGSASVLNLLSISSG